MKTIAVFITSFNRKEKTLRFLQKFYESAEYSDFSFQLFLVDDASPDQTGKQVLKQFPEVKVLMGTGNLFWAGGLRLILDHLGDKLGEFDGIILANDDIELFTSSLNDIINIGVSQNAIVGGTVTTDEGLLESSGSKLGKICRPRVKILKANGNVQSCDLLPGHIMYIPMKIYHQLGGFDQNLPYRFIDLEFTLRASQNNVSVLLAPEVVAITDEVHNYFNETSLMRGSFTELKKNILLHPKGPYWRESVYYLKKVSPILWWLWLPFFYRAFLVALIKSHTPSQIIGRKMNLFS